MDHAQLDRLRQQQDLAIADTEARIQQLKKYQVDYKDLRDRLDTLPDEVSYDAMVPFGRLAFMPGQLIHTNELLVLLGDDWFVERSAKQASGIVSRRIEALSVQLRELEKQKGLLEPRKHFTEEIQQVNQTAEGVVEIQEEYNEEAEKQWRVEHRENIRKARIADKEERSAKVKAVNEQKESCPLSDVDLWARLEELEREETARGEMHRTSSEESEEDLSSEESSEDVAAIEGDRHVQWKDQKASLRTHSTIYFTHGHSVESTRQQLSHECPKEQSMQTDQMSAGSLDGVEVTNSTSSSFPISSPSDIYKYFYKPTSILKSPTSEEAGNLPNSKQKQATEMKPLAWLSETTEAQAFSGEIVEHAITEPHSEPLPSAQAPPRRVSKFRAQRMQQGNS